MKVSYRGKGDECRAPCLATCEFDQVVFVSCSHDQVSLFTPAKHRDSPWYPHARSEPEAASLHGQLHQLLFLSIHSSVMSFPNSRRPPLRYENSNQSLTGLERAIPPVTPSPKLSVSSIGAPSFTSTKSDLNKPLPPKPLKRRYRRSSSIYSQTQDEILDSYFYRDDRPEENLIPTRAFMPPAHEKLNTLSPPGLDFLASKVYGGPFEYTTSDSMLPLSHNSSRVLQDRVSGFEAPYRYSSPASPPGSPAQVGLKNSSLAWERRPWERTPDLAEQYRDTLPARSLTPPSFARLQYPNDLVYAGARMSSRIINVDGSDLASPSYTSESYSRSHSPTSDLSEFSADETEPRLSIFRTCANKAMHRNDPPREDQERERVMSIASQKYPAMNNTLPTKARHRSSIQSRVGDIYHTLASIPMSPNRKPSNPAKHGMPRGQRNPAIRLTAYQQMGTKAWETPPLPKTPKTPHKIKFAKETKTLDSPESLKDPKTPKTPKISKSPDSPNSPDSPHSMKSTRSSKSPRSGLPWLTNRKQKANEAKMNSRREEIKKSIVVVGPANHSSLLSDAVIQSGPLGELYNVQSNMEWL